MKAVILVAGFGSRLKPLTDTTAKSLLPIGDSTPLANTIERFNAHGVEEYIFITGSFDQQIKSYIAKRFPDLTAHYVRKVNYPSNTGYSLMLAAPYIGNEPFIKIDGDLIFEDTIIERLQATPDDANYLCLDRTTIDNEVIKVKVDHENSVTAIGKGVPTAQAIGESIGLEKICSSTSKVLLSALKTHMTDKNNWQEYYEFTYDYLVRNNLCTFKCVDVSGLRWVEIDTPADYELAKKYFG